MSSPICKFFRSEQGCKFGNKCRYKHSQSSLPFVGRSLSDHQNEGSVRRSAPQESQVCSQDHLVSTSCENESPVRNQELVSRYSSTESSDPRFSSDNNGSSVVATDNFSAASEPHQLNKFEQLQLTHSDGKAVNSGLPSKKVCHYFTRYGNCCFGSRCRFEHAGPHREQPPRFRQLPDSRKPPSEVKAAANQASGLQNDPTKEGKRMSFPGDDGNIKFSSCPLTQHGSGDHCSKGTEDNKSAAERQQLNPDRVCQFYQAGKCWRGNRCKFLHPGHSSAQSVHNKLAAHHDNRQGKQPDSGGHQDYSQKQQSEGLYGNRRQQSGGYLDNGQRRKLEKDISNPKETVKPVETPVKDQGHSTESSCKQASSTTVHQPRPPYIPQGTKKYRREEVDEVEASRLRRLEIDQLIKRFPKGKLKVHRDCAEYFQCVIDFSPSDPDWPFDVRVFQLKVDIPSDYPFEMMSISLPCDQGLPETVRRYLEVSVDEWLEDKEKQLEDNSQVELVFRPFHRWLDRNIEDIVTEGLKQLKREMVAKAAGLEFISAKQLQQQYRSRTSSESNDEEESTEDEETQSDSEEGSDSSSDADNIEEDEQPGNTQEGEDEQNRNSGKKGPQDKIKAMMAEPERKGTEIGMKNLQMRENAATLHFEKICLAVQCERCKGSSEFMAGGGRVNVVQCSQCNQRMVATYRPAMVHPFSPVMGYLDLDACLPYDVILQNSNVIISCLNCSKETKPGTMLPGQALDHWCRVCHCKLRVAADGIRFTQLEPRAIQSLKGAVKVVVPTRRRLPKDPSIQEGKPLPDFGTCKHYKKSYRWLRFPCCGKCYPCDMCHDSKEDHPMTFANRSICGFCCKEQPFAADRPCKGCDMNMTRVHSKHWEGGQGCRDKISMSKNDKQKHSNMAKTVSRHAQKVKEMQSKKRTKLRHT